MAKDVDVSKPPIFPPKKKIQIANADALKNNEDNSELEPKISLGSKPSLFRGKKEGKLIATPRTSTLLRTATGRPPNPRPWSSRRGLNWTSGARRGRISSSRRRNTLSALALTTAGKPMLRKAAVSPASWTSKSRDSTPGESSRTNRKTRIRVQSLADRASGRPSPASPTPPHCCNIER